MVSITDFLKILIKLITNNWKSFEAFKLLLLTMGDLGVKKVKNDYFYIVSLSTLSQHPFSFFLLSNCYSDMESFSPCHKGALKGTVLESGSESFGSLHGQVTSHSACLRAFSQVCQQLISGSRRQRSDEVQRFSLFLYVAAGQSRV